MMQCCYSCVFAALRLLALVALGFPCGCFFSQSATTLGALCSSSPRPIQYEYLYQEFKISLRCMVRAAGGASLFCGPRQAPGAQAGGRAHRGPASTAMLRIAIFAAVNEAVFLVTKEEGDDANEAKYHYTPPKFQHRPRQHALCCIRVQVPHQGQG